MVYVRGENEGISSHRFGQVPRIKTGWDQVPAVTFADELLGRFPAVTWGWKVSEGLLLRGLDGAMARPLRIELAVVVIT